MGAMTFYIEDTARERTRAALAAADRPLTAAGIADQLNTTPEAAISRQAADQANGVGQAGADVQQTSRGHDKL